MKNVMSALQKMIPEGIESLKTRYTLLQVILDSQPIGRRKLATITSLSERTVRSETDLLAKQGLIEIKQVGMILTPQGEKALDRLYEPINHLECFAELEKTLEQALGLRRAIIVKGDVDRYDTAKWRLGKAGANVLKNLIKDDYTISLTGGTTVAKVIESMKDDSGKYNGMMVVPARGSLGERVDIQGNTLVVDLARKLGADYTLLHISDNLSEASIHTIKQEPYIQKTLQIMAKSDIIIFGIGNAIQMANRRKEDVNTLKLLEERQAVGEAFRYYFNEQGDIVYGLANIGLEQHVFEHIPNKIAVVGGKSKAQAILSARKMLKGADLVIDEGAAREVANVLEKQEIS